MKVAVPLRQFIAQNTITVSCQSSQSSNTCVQDLCKEYNIPTGSYEVFRDPEPAKSYIRERGAPIVVKAVGLAAGKGVVVAQTVDEALTAVDDMLVKQRFGEAGKDSALWQRVTVGNIRLLVPPPAACQGSRDLCQ